MKQMKDDEESEEVLEKQRERLEVKQSGDFDPFEDGEEGMFDLNFLKGW